MNEIPSDARTKSRFTASIGNYLSFGSYLGAYQNAFEALMQTVYQSNHSVDYMAYPILYIARHCIELGFKTNIRYFMKYSGKNDYTNAGTHNLFNLFQGFRLHVNSTITNLKTKYGADPDPKDIQEFNRYCAEVEKLTNIFHLLDKDSDSFRYPVNKKNENSFEPRDTINLIDVKALYDESMVLLKYTSDVFAKYTDYIDGIEDMYEAEMLSQYMQY